MNTTFRRLRTALSDLVAEDRPGYKRIDASPARSDDGAWLEPRRRQMDHLAIGVRDQERSRRFYESYCGFGARPARTYDDGVLMLYNAAGFALALGPYEPIAKPDWLHFGFGLPDRDAVLAFKDRLARDGVELHEFFDEPDYVSIKFRDPDGYIIEASWEPS